MRLPIPYPPDEQFSHLQSLQTDQTHFEDFLQKHELRHSQHEGIVRLSQQASKSPLLLIPFIQTNGQAYETAARQFVCLPPGKEIPLQSYSLRQEHFP